MDRGLLPAALASGIFSPYGRGNGWLRIHKFDESGIQYDMNLAELLKFPLLSSPCRSTGEGGNG